MGLNPIALRLVHAQNNMPMKLACDSVNFIATGGEVVGTVNL